MAYNYGYIEANPNNQNWPYKGKIASPVLTGNIGLMPVDKRSPKAPDFEVHQSVDGGTVHVGSAWVEKDKKGRDYFKLCFDGPTMAIPFWVNAFLYDNPDPAMPNRFDIVWQRQRADKRPENAVNVGNNSGF